MNTTTFLSFNFLRSFVVNSFFFQLFRGVRAHLIALSNFPCLRRARYFVSNSSNLSIVVIDLLPRCSVKILLIRGIKKGTKSIAAIRLIGAFIALVMFEENLG